MAPAFIRLHDSKSRGPSTTTFIREAETMHVQSTLYSRSITATNSSSGSSGSVDGNTIIFIVVAVVCLLVILIGFYFVSRPRAASNAAPSVPSSHPQHSPITHPPRALLGRGMSEYWKNWKIRRHSNPHLHITADTPTSQAFPAAATIINTSPTISARNGSETYPPIISRPSQARRITSLSVATSFSHSHITEEELNNFRLSAYDLDGDLETEMLNSATDDVWSGRALVLEGCEGVGVGVEEAIKVQGNATHIIEGSVDGHVPPRPTTQWRGGDYENLGACQNVASGNNGVEGDVIEIDKAVLGRQAFQ